MSLVFVNSLACQQCQHLPLHPTSFLTTLFSVTTQCRVQSHYSSDHPGERRCRQSLQHKPVLLSLQFFRQAVCFWLNSVSQTCFSLPCLLFYSAYLLGGLKRGKVFLTSSQLENDTWEWVLKNITAEMNGQTKECNSPCLFGGKPLYVVLLEE